MVNRIVETSENMGMRINADKTEIQFLGAGDKQFQIEAMGQQLQQTGTFVYLGGSINTENGSVSDIERRITLHNITLKHLYTAIYNKSNRKDLLLCQPNSRTVTTWQRKCPRAAIPILK